MLNKKRTAWIVLTAYLAFIGLGMTSGLLGIAWPSIQAEFRLSLDGVNAFYIAQTVTYTLAGFFIGRVMGRLGSGKALLGGAAVMTVCMFGIAVAPVWAFVVLLGFIFGLGSGILDAGLNLYIAAYHTPRQMNFLHASFGIGITLGPIIMTAVLQRHGSWRIGYGIAGSILLGLVALIALTRPSWRTGGFSDADNSPVARATYGKTLLIPAVWLGMATFLIYVGLEIGIGQWAYTLLISSRGVAPGVAGPWVSAYWGAFTGGRFLWGAVGNRLPITWVLRGSMLSTLAGASLFAWNPTPTIGCLSLTLLGFAQAPVFALLMAETESRVGASHAENTIGLQMSAVGVGAALIPGLIGTIGKVYGLERMSVAFTVMAAAVFLCHELSRPKGHIEF